MIAIIDYGVGNLFSLESSFKAIGQEVVVTKDSEIIRSADKVVLPGVGAFEDAINKLRQNHLDTLIIDLANNGKPLLGICLGMQMLFEESFEYGNHKGLGLIPGKVIPMNGNISDDLKIPHIGWNQLNIVTENCPIFKYISNGDYVYFVHSYYASECDEYVVANTSYSIEITAAVQKENIFGCQFHPEKSGKVGLAILKAFSQL